MDRPVSHAKQRRPAAAATSVPECSPDDVPWLSVAQMARVDQLMVNDLNISLLQMMENAGRNLAVLARDLLGGDAFDRRVHVLAGAGGNGGGGLVAARHLHNAGAHVRVSLSESHGDLAAATATQLQSLSAMGVPVDVGVPSTPTPELVLDALLGYSQSGDPRGELARMIEWCSGRRTLALDVPSGLELATDTVRTPCVQAEATLTLALPKLGLRAVGAAAVVGDLFLGDISVPPVVYERIGETHQSPFGRSPIVRLVPQRAPDVQPAIGPLRGPACQ